MNNKGALLKELFTNLSTTGAITFSSKSLVNKMLSFANFRGVKLIVELGGGDGSITQGIVERMDPDAVLLVFEINKPFFDNLKKIFPQKNVKIICDSAENIDQYLVGKKADLILSLPKNKPAPASPRCDNILALSAPLREKRKMVRAETPRTQRVNFLFFEWVND